jgi:hypothetical protein
MVCTICSVAHQQWWLISHFSLFFFFTLFDFSFLFLFLTYTKVAARFARPGSLFFSPVGESALGTSDLDGC